MKKQTEGTNSNRSLEEALFIFRRKLLDAVKEEAASLNFPVSHIDVMSYVAEKGNPSMKEVANHLKIAPPSATVIIEAMQKKNLITRVVSDKDRRTIRIALTPKAWKFFRSFHKRKLDILTKMLSKLQDTEKKQFIKIINILIKE